MPTDEYRWLRTLEVEVDAELAVAESNPSDEEFSVPPEQWLFDPTDIEREEVGLRGLQGAVRALESVLEPNSRPSRPKDKDEPS